MKPSIEWKGLVCFSMFSSLLLNLKKIHSQYQATPCCCLFGFPLYSDHLQDKTACETCPSIVHESDNVSEPTYASRLVSLGILWLGKIPSPPRLPERNYGMVVHGTPLF
jgi:hypothetical protein